MRQYFFGLLLIVVCSINNVSLYADALDDLVNQKKAEQVAEEHNRKQEQEKAKQKAQELVNIEDCEQAVEKALEKRKAIEAKIGNLALFINGAAVNTEGVIMWWKNPKVCGFAKKGIFICYDMSRYYQLGIHDYFIYTTNTNYATGDLFKETSVIYKEAGYYKSEKIQGDIESVLAFEATSYKVSDIMPKTYLENKELMCCQCTTKKTDAFKEIGVVKDKDKSVVGKYGYGDACKTRNHPRGFRWIDDNVVVYY